MTDHDAIRTRRSTPLHHALCTIGTTLVLAVSPVLAGSAFGQGATTAASARHESVRFASVTGENVYFRSGPAETYYPMGRLGKDDVLMVLDERFGWTRVLMQGPAFREFFAHIRSPRGDNARFERLSPTRGRTVGRVDLLAPNLNTQFRPADSWKRLRLLDNGTELTIRDVVSTDETDFFLVSIPEGTEGWISSSFLAPASRADFDRFVARHTAPAQAEAPESAATEERPAAPPLARETPRTPETEVRRTTPVTPDAEVHPAPEVERATETTETAPASRTEPASPAPERESAEPAPPTAMEELEALEAAFVLLQAQPIDDAEVIPLRDLYLHLIRTHTDNAAVTRFAERRIEQLTLWHRLQERRQRLAELERRVDVVVEDVVAARTRMETTGTYAAVGRLVASTIFEGERLPRLFRLQDPTSGRTLAYIRPDTAFDLPAMLGQVIGVSGDRSFDAGLRIDIIRPRRIDLLVPGS